jgi:diadenosine tetraphosphatase ApaH/serine/threonine PP2A family protein phosphatase
MKYIILSDIHSNLQAFEAVLKSFPKGGGYEVICAGDVVGYGADPVKCVEKVLSLGAKNVLGNHDAGVIGKTDISFFNSYASMAVYWTMEHIDAAVRGYLEGLPYVLEEEAFVVAHGTLHDPEEFIYMMTGADAMHTFEVLKKKICFVGHSHVPGMFKLKEGGISQVFGKRIALEEGAQYIVNAGSVGQPRDGDPRACYCVYDPEKGYVEFRRVEYDISSAAKSIIEAGLPELLAERLFAGR